MARAAAVVAWEVWAARVGTGMGSLVDAGVELREAAEALD